MRGNPVHSPPHARRGPPSAGSTKEGRAIFGTQEQKPARVLMRELLLGDADLRRFVTARVLSRAGDALYPIGLTAAMLHTGYGATEVGFVIAAATGPVVLLMLVGGVLLDRVRPRVPMIVADVARFFLQGGVAVLLWIGRPALWSIVALSLAVGVAQAFFQPGVAAMLRTLAADRIQESNALIRTAEAVVALTAPALAGLVVAVSGGSAVIAVDALSFAVSGYLLWRIRTGPAARPVGRPQLRRDLAIGWREFTSRSWLWSVVLVFTFLGLLMFGPYDILKTVLLINRFGTPTYGLLLSAYSLGTIGGGLIAMRPAAERPLRRGASALTGLALVPAAIALQAPLVLIALAMIVGGGAYALWAVTWATAVQSHSPPQALSRISSYDVIGSTALIPVGRALSGPAAAAFGAGAVLLSASVCLLLGCAVLLCVPAVTGLRRTVAARKGAEDTADGKEMAEGMETKSVEGTGRQLRSADRA